MCGMRKHEKLYKCVPLRAERGGRWNYFLLLFRRIPDTLQAKMLSADIPRPPFGAQPCLDTHHLHSADGDKDHVYRGQFQFAHKTMQPVCNKDKTAQKR